METNKNKAEKLYPFQLIDFSIEMTAEPSYGVIANIRVIPLTMYGRDILLSRGIGGLIEIINKGLIDLKDK